MIMEVNDFNIETSIQSDQVNDDVECNVNDILINACMRPYTD